MSTLTASPVAAPGRDLRNHSSIAQTVQNTLTMAWRGLLKIRRTPEQLLDVTVQPILFTLMFTYLFGGELAGDVPSYMPIILPGILGQPVIPPPVVPGV